MRVLLDSDGTITELVKVKSWSWSFQPKDWRVGVAFTASSLDVNLPCLQIWRETWHRHGKTLERIPADAEVITVGGPSESVLTLFKAYKDEEAAR